MTVRLDRETLIFFWFLKKKKMEMFEMGDCGATASREMGFFGV